jgi:hypothetical protein
MTICNTEIKEISFKKLKALSVNRFGFVILGAGDPKEEWITGIERLLKERNIVDSNGTTFSEAYIEVILREVMEELI